MKWRINKEWWQDGNEEVSKHSIYFNTLICLDLYKYWSLYNVWYIIRNQMCAFQCKFNHINPFSCSWDISQQSFCSYWWADISVFCCCFCTTHICVDSPHLGLSSTTWFVKISPLVVEIQAEWSLWHIY